jgi:hypothetical protein
LSVRKNENVRFWPEITVSADANHHIPQKPNLGRESAVAKRERKNWRELCNAALGANDPDELLKILQELNRVLKREEQVRRDFREAMRAKKASA